MIVELRKKSQITIPKDIVSAMNLKEGDHLEINYSKGVIHMEPVAIYSKAYVEKLEKSIMTINENPDKYTEGPFSSVEEAIKYLESDEEYEKTKNDRKTK